MFDFVAVDFETANKNLNSACSIGLVAVRDLEVVEKKYYLIKPPTDHFSHDNILIHGITYDDVKDCDNFSIIWNEISHYFNDIIIAHNAQFDMSVLKNLADTYNIVIPNFIYADSIVISNSVCTGNTNLSARAKELNVVQECHHNAIDDALTCANIVINSVNKFGYDSFSKFILKYEILPKDFTKIKANKSFAKPTSSLPNYKNIKISELSAATSEFNLNHPFYNKSIVLTGELDSFERPAAMQKILNVGGIVKSAVSSKTDYLVVGIQDKKLVGDDGLSTKEEKAYDLISKGSDIKIIKEDEFLKLLNYAPL